MRLCLAAILLLVAPEYALGMGTPAEQAGEPAVHLLSPLSRDLPTGESRIEAAVDGFLEGDQVDFFVNGRKVATVKNPPWVTSWQAGDTVRRYDISVVLVRGGREIAKGRVRTRDVGFTSTAGAHAVGLAPIVTDEKGRHVRGLRKEDFSVFDEGERQEIETFDAADSPLAAILLVDNSESMVTKQDEARRAAHAFIDALKPEDEIGLYAFNSSIVTAIEPTRRRAPLHTALDEARPSGATALYDAAAAAIRRLKSIKKRKAIVLFTDGEDNQSRLSVDQVIDMARASEVSIFSIAQGRDEATTLREFLDRLADQTGGRSYFIGSIKKLPATFQAILAELKSQYFLTYTPKGKLRARSWRRVQVRVNRPYVLVRTKKEYFVG